MNRLLQLFDGKEFIFMDGATGTMLQQQGVVNYELFVGKKMPLDEYNKFQAEQAK